MCFAVPARFKQASVKQASVKQAHATVLKRACVCVLQGPSAESSPAKLPPAAGLADVPAVKFAQRYGPPDRGAAGDGSSTEPDLAAGLNGSSAPAGTTDRFGDGP